MPGKVNNFIEFDFLDLIIPTLIIFLIGIVISYSFLKNLISAFLVAWIKAFLFCLYFGFFFDGTYTSGLDDYWYLENGAIMVSKFNDGTLSLGSLPAITGAFHYGYVIVSTLAQYAFGEFYFSLPAFNVIISFICGLLVFNIVNSYYQNVFHARLLGMAVMLHPEVLSWTTIFAGKDVFVLVGHLLFIYSLVLLLRRSSIKAFLLAAAGFLFLMRLRFYVPVIIAVPYFLFGLKFIPKSMRILIIIGAFAMPLIGFTIIDGSLIDSYIKLTLEGLTYVDLSFLKIMESLVYGIPHFWLTPRPFFEDEIHAFLLLANLFNWMTFPLLIFGMLKCLLSKDRLAQFLFWYFLIFGIFYGFVDYLNGPRHRLQLNFAILFFCGLR